MSTELPRSIGRPATGAFAGAGLTTLEDFTRVTEKEIAALHGVGPKAIGIIRELLKERGLAFAEH
ncbi:DNA-binding protein [Actinokineospora sp. HUAS TT18]|uniref:DNA-binding protein n=1 Tax=Actinokineospora sp. HUAS TT18 TaxID=3447451 RepID=UPI003F51B4DE